MRRSPLNLQRIKPRSPSRVHASREAAKGQECRVDLKNFLVGCTRLYAATSRNNGAESRQRCLQLVKVARMLGIRPVELTVRMANARRAGKGVRMGRRSISK